MCRLNTAAFIEYLQKVKRYSDHTIKSYTTDLAQFEAFMQSHEGTFSWLKVEHYNIRSWSVELMDRGLTARSINRKLSSLGSFYLYLKRAGHIDYNPLAKVVRPKQAKRLPEFVKEEEIESLLDSNAFENSFEGSRDRLVVELLYSCGLRRSELLSLKITSIDLERDTLKVRGKGNKERSIPIPGTVKKCLSDFLHYREEQAFESESLILTNNGKPGYPKLIYNIVTRYLGRVSTLKKKSPHTLRHSYATHLTNNGAELNAVKELLGHASLAATQVYTHNSIAKLKEAYDKAHPKAK